jgi:hypothetical protein
MSDTEDDFEMLLDRVRSLTGLTGRDAAKVAFEFEDPTAVSPQEIVDKAIELGFDVERKHGKANVVAATPLPEMTMNPAEVLSEVYMVMPRVLSQDYPRIGRAPAELQQLDPDFIEGLPEDVKALLVKIDLFEGAATFWLRDEANDVDRPIGPIDLNRWIDADHDTPEQAMEKLTEAFLTLLQRINRVITADFN